MQAIDMAAARGPDLTFGTAAKREPQYPFIATEGGAWRIAVVNDDGAWACALIVQRPKVTAADAIEKDNYVLTLDTNSDGTVDAGENIPDFAGDAVTSVTAWMVGEWYDRGERLLGGTNNIGMDSVCSPVVGTSAAGHKFASLPTGVGEWPVGAVKQGSGKATWLDGSTADNGTNVLAETVWRTLKDRL